eukprot:5940609-Prymnesium_polylepis.1
MKAGLRGFHLPHHRDSESNVILNGRRRSVSDVTNVLNNRGSTASPAWDAGLKSRMPTRRGTLRAGLTWAVTPARGREKSRGPSSRPLISPSYREADGR